MTKGFDCATKLTLTSASNLKKEGFEYAARYLGNSWKTFDQQEAGYIRDAGIKLISIFQKSANHASYFSEEQGRRDGLEAFNYAKAVGQPAGTAIYFAVDFDVSDSQIPIIQAYFRGIKETLQLYKIGVYGSYLVINSMKDQVDYYWQTYAWSRGERASFIHMHQYENNVTVAGVNIDRNEIFKEPGHWTAENKPNEVPASYYVNADTGAYVTAMDAKSATNCKGTVKAGEYFVFNTSQGMLNVTKQQGVPGSWINPTPTTIHIVQAGDNLTKIAKKYHTTISHIQAKNPDIKNINLIYPGQKIEI